MTHQTEQEWEREKALVKSVRNEAYRNAAARIREISGAYGLPMDAGKKAVLLQAAKAIEAEITE